VIVFNIHQPGLDGGLRLQRRVLRNIVVVCDVDFYFFHIYFGLADS
jgi:hypothetical protein